MFQRNLQKFNCQTFCDDLDDAIENFFQSNNDINPNNFSSKLFSDFVKVVHEAIDFYASYEKLSRKQVKLKLKPWLTKGLLTSTKHKQKLYITHFIHVTGTFNQKQQYKKYANKLNKVKFMLKKTFFIKRTLKISTSCFLDVEYY